MTELYLVIIGVLLPSLFTSAGAAVKYRADAQGWKTSYENERARNQAHEQVDRDRALATDIALRVTTGLTKAIEGLKGQGGTQP